MTRTKVSGARARYASRWRRYGTQWDETASAHTFRTSATVAEESCSLHGMECGEPDASEARNPVGRPATEDDQLSHTAGKPWSIDTHTTHVVANVDHFVQTLHPDQSVASDLKLAASLHDAGKADPRFQNLLSGGDPWNRPDGPAMAKSSQPSPKGAWERAGLPKRWRHEALSVRMALAHPRFAEAHDPALRAVVDRYASRIRAAVLRFRRFARGRVGSRGIVCLSRRRALAACFGTRTAVDGVRPRWRRLGGNVRATQAAVRHLGIGSPGSGAATGGPSRVGVRATR